MEKIMSIFNFFKKKKQPKTEVKTEPGKSENSSEKSDEPIEAGNVIYIENDERARTETENMEHIARDETVHAEADKFSDPAEKITPADKKIYKVLVDTGAKIVTVEAHGDNTSDGVLKWLEEQEYISSAEDYEFTDWPTIDDKNGGDRYCRWRAMRVKELPCRIYHIRYEKRHDEESLDWRDQSFAALYAPPSYFNSEDTDYVAITIDDINEARRKK